jgi:hypothetical protein
MWNDKERKLVIYHDADRAERAETASSIPR